MKAVFYTAAELAARGPKDIPRELVSSTHLIYSSPATLAFNSPGAEGYGVKRAGLAVPGSVMLIVSPGCCGRNTSAISRMPGYEDRFFYLTMDETDLVTGRHLKKIPAAVGELCRALGEKGKRPRVVMICITCVDALLGTDMERVCRRAEEKVPGVRVRPCYMYALTREGRKPPMVHVRQSLYALLEPRKKKASSVNLLGFFAPLEGIPEKRDAAGDGSGSLTGAGSGSQESTDSGSLSVTGSGSELPAVLRQAGVRTVRQIGACADYDEFQKMAEANFNLVLNPEARPAAYDLQERLGIPFIELNRFYQIDRIRAQYAALGSVLQTGFDVSAWEEEAEKAVADFRKAFPGAVFSIGEAANANPFELACALAREGFAVREIFGTVSEDSFVWIRLLAAISPDTRIYSNLHPSMLHYQADEEPDPAGKTSVQQLASSSHSEKVPAQQQEPSSHSEKVSAQQQTSSVCSENESPLPSVTISIGRDAGWYHPDVPNVQWNTDVQPFGFRAVTGLFTALRQAMETGSRGSYASRILLEGQPEKVYKDGGSFCTDGCLEAAYGNAGVSASDGFPETSLKNGGASVSDGFPQTAQDPGPSGSPAAAPRGFRRFTTPFAPDQSGAVSILYDMGGICVICDAGGCTGNICGFDEPRWFGRQSAVFSAGLRDMDAILGRDDRLVEKLADASGQIPADFAAIVGTPVPAVIGTDYRALVRLAEKKTDLPVIGVNTDGMEYYDRGIEKTLLALLETFGKDNRPAADRSAAPDSTNMIGIWGYSPLDFEGILSEEKLRGWAKEQGYDRIICCGAGTLAESLRDVSWIKKNIVVSPAGTEAAVWLEKRFGTGWEYCIPDAENILRKVLSSAGAAYSGNSFLSGKKILVVHQDVLARILCGLLQKEGAQADAASFFMTQPAKGIYRLREETDLRALVLEQQYDLVIADRALRPILEGTQAGFLHLPHFAVSGTLSP